MNTFAFMMALTLMIGYMFMVYEQHSYFNEILTTMQRQCIKKYELEGVMNYAIAYYLKNKSKIQNNVKKKLSYKLKDYCSFARYIVNNDSSTVEILVDIYDKKILYATDAKLLTV